VETLAAVEKSGEKVLRMLRDESGEVVIRGAVTVRNLVAAGMSKWSSEFRRAESLDALREASKQADDQVKDVLIEVLKTLLSKQ